MTFYAALMVRVVVPLALLLSLTSPAIAQQAPDARAKWEEGQRSDQSFYRQQFTEMGFVPIEELDAGSRDVRRIIVRDPYGFLPIPGVEFERRRDGKVTMRLQFPQYRTDTVSINAAAWQRIVVGDAAMFAPRQYEQVPPVTSIPPVCHGWMILVQASGDRAGSWWQCRDSADAKADYVRTMIEEALSTRPDCKREEDPRWAFQKCFGEKEQLDDPELDALYSPLLKELKDAPGAEKLAAARRALNAPALTLGSPEWVAARAAIYDVLKLQEERKAILIKLGQLEYRARNASQPDKVKLRQSLRHWREFLNGQDANHVDLLRRLGWANIADKAL